jgi:hypothetical protein
LAAFVTDFAKIQLMKILQVSAQALAGRPALSAPAKKAETVRARGEITYMTVP